MMRGRLISILCPTRERPARCAAMIDSAFRLARGPGRVEARLLVDHDDPSLAAYREMPSHDVFLTVQEPRISNPAGMNRLAMEMAQGDILIAASDDVLFRTEGWDEAIDSLLACHPDDLVFGFFNDGRDRDKAEHFFVTRRWAETVGYFMRPEYEHFCADEHVETIAAKAGRRFWLRDVTLEHLHFKYGKADRDRTYDRTRRGPLSGRSMTDRDRERLLRFTPEIELAADRLRAAMRAAA
jgi:hypothetical protein